MSTQQNNNNERTPQVSMNLLNAMEASRARLNKSTAIPNMGGEDTIVTVKAWRSYNGSFAMQNGSSESHIVILTEFVTAARPLTFMDYNVSMVEQERLGLNKGSLFIPGGTIQLALSIEDYVQLNNKATELDTSSIAFQIKIKDQGKGFIGTTRIGEYDYTIVSFQASEPTVLMDTVEIADAYWADNNPSKYPPSVTLDREDPMYALQLEANETSNIKANMARASRPAQKEAMVNSSAARQLFQIRTKGNPPIVKVEEQEQELVSVGSDVEEDF